MRARIVCLLAAVCCMVCGCGEEKREESAKTGRYAETEMELPGGGGNYTGLTQEGDRIRLQGAEGYDLVSVSAGESFAEEVFESYGKWKNRTLREIAAPNGARLVIGMEDSEPFGISGYYLVSEDGQETALTGIDPETAGAVCYGGGYFYCEAGEQYQIYRVDPTGGEVRFLLEGYYPYGMAADDRRLYLQCYDRLTLYDLEKGEIAAQQDEILDGFLKEKLSAGTVEQDKNCLYPYGDGTYILTAEGIYWHAVYGDSVELVVDGALYRMGSPGVSLLGMAVVEGTEEPEFLVLYSDGSLVLYRYDASLPAEPEFSLRVYSLYEDGNVRRMVGAFRQAHPELSVRYETGTGLEYGASEEDALKNLATELAAGKGPDIIVADEIPFRSYAEKGVFMELSGIMETMTDDTYFKIVADGMRNNEGLYAIPLSFAIPVIGGSGEKLGDGETLADLADMLERERRDGRSGSLFGVWNPEDMLRKLAQSSQGAWTKEDGTLDKEAVAEFLTWAKRIYDVQMKDQEENAWGMGDRWAAGGSPLDRRFSGQGINSAREAARFSAGHEQPYFGGILGSGKDDFSFFCANVNYMGADYTLMPGQQYGACLAESLLAVNQASGHREEALLFLEYALSAEGQQAAGLNGIPVNREAYLAGWDDPRGEGMENILYSGTMIDDGDEDYDDMVFLEVYWPGEDAFRKLDGFVSRITSVGYCDSRVYHAVVEAGQGFLEGKRTLEEALEDIDTRVKLYLEE